MVFNKILIGKKHLCCSPNFVARSNSDALQSQCSPGRNWASGKLRARDGEQCKNQDSSTQLDPNVFESIILPPGSDPKGLSITSVLSQEEIKCPPPYIYNVCCNGMPDGFSGAENFFKIWTQIKGCYLGMEFFMKQSSKIVNGSRKVLTYLPVPRYMTHAVRTLM